MKNILREVGTIQIKEIIVEIETRRQTSIKIDVGC